MPRVFSLIWNGYIRIEGMHLKKNNKNKIRHKKWFIKAERERSNRKKYWWNDIKNLKVFIDSWKLWKSKRIERYF